MAEQQDTDLFEEELRHALQSLYDPSELRKSRLLGLLQLDDGHSPLTQVRRALAESIEALHPESHVPPDAAAWRIYNVLTYRYIEQLGQREAAADLCLSVRQLRRDEHAAIRVLADHLRHRFNIRPETPQADDGMAGKSDTFLTGTKQELDWLRLTFPQETVSVHTIIETALATAAPLINASRVKVSYDLPPDLAPVVGQLNTARQALLNVLSATVPAAAGGEIEIKAAELRDRSQQTELTICAQLEDGTPVTKDVQMAEAFAVSRQLLALAGGALRIDNACCECLVTLSLPTALPQRVPILVVDDNVDTLQLFRRYLAENAFDLVSVSDPEMALSRAVDVQPDIIVLDVMLPGIDGWELLGRLREHPDTREIPVIICTILPQEKLAMALGAAGFLQKPFSRESLFAVLADLVDQTDSPESLMEQP